MKRVFVYYNLHKKCWSIRYKGIVIYHAHQVLLSEVKFKVSETGRQRVLKEKRKNVHAGVEGILLKYDQYEEGYNIPVSYNPYRGPHFCKTETNEPVFVAPFAYLDNRKVFLRN